MGHTHSSYQILAEAASRKIASSAYGLEAQEGWAIELTKDDRPFDYNQLTFRQDTFKIGEKTFERIGMNIINPVAVLEKNDPAKAMMKDSFVKADERNNDLKTWQRSLQIDFSRPVSIIGISIVKEQGAPDSEHTVVVKKQSSGITVKMTESQLGEHISTDGDQLNKLLGGWEFGRAIIGNARKYGFKHDIHGNKAMAAIRFFVGSALKKYADEHNIPLIVGRMENPAKDHHDAQIPFITSPMTRFTSLANLANIAAHVDDAPFAYDHAEIEKFQKISNEQRNLPSFFGTMEQVQVEDIELVGMGAMLNSIDGRLKLSLAFAASPLLACRAFDSIPQSLPEMFVSAYFNVTGKPGDKDFNISVSLKQQDGSTLHSPVHNIRGRSRNGAIDEVKLAVMKEIVTHNRIPASFARSIAANNTEIHATANLVG